MHSFDHRYYPHILDLIFDHADTATQAALSQVCKQWRQRWTAEYFWVTGFNAQREWGCQCSGVIYSDDSEDDTDTESVQSEDNPQAYWFFTPKGEEISLESLASFDWLRRCRVVDLSNEAWSLKCDHDLYIDTLRVPYPHSGGYWCYKKAIVHLTHLKCRRVIFDNTLRLLPGYDISKLVVNFRSADFGHFRFLDLATHPIKVDHVVFIAHALNKHPTKIHKSTARPADVRGEAGSLVFC